MKSSKILILFIIIANFLFSNIENVSAQLPEIKEITFVLKTPPSLLNIIESMNLLSKKIKFSLKLKDKMNY